MFCSDYAPLRQAIDPNSTLYRLCLSSVCSVSSSQPSMNKVKRVQGGRSTPPPPTSHAQCLRVMITATHQLHRYFFFAVVVGTSVQCLPCDVAVQCLPCGSAVQCLPCGDTVQCLPCDVAVQCLPCGDKVLAMWRCRAVLAVWCCSAVLAVWCCSAVLAVW